MIIWTVQPVSALRDLETDGVFRCDRSQSFNLMKADTLERPYRWLIQRMTEKIGAPPAGVEYPIWAWHTWEFARRRPDTESAVFVRRTEEKVLFTLDVPEEALVLSDFDAWQYVLMDSYVADAVTEEEFDALKERLEGLDGEELRVETERSWVNVFKTDPVNSELLIRGRYVQATFWEIRREYVKDAKLLPVNA